MVIAGSSCQNLVLLADRLPCPASSNVGSLEASKRKVLGIQNLAPWTSPPLLPRLAYSVTGTKRLIIGRALKVPVQVAGSPDVIPPGLLTLPGGPLIALLAFLQTPRSASMFFPACLPGLRSLRSLRSQPSNPPASRPNLALKTSSRLE